MTDVKDYLTTDFTDDELISLYEQFKYRGFSRESVLTKLAEINFDPKLAAEISILCALRGPQRSALIRLSNGKTPLEMGIPASTAPGTSGLTILRIHTALPRVAALALKRLNVDKRLPVVCPAYLQFPAAVGLRMSPELRRMHMEFSVEFSKVIGGVFNEQIYRVASQNAFEEAP